MNVHCFLTGFSPLIFKQIMSEIFINELCVCVICTHAALPTACLQELGNGSLERCYPTSPASPCHPPPYPPPPLPPTRLFHSHHHLPPTPSPNNPLPYDSPHCPTTQSPTSVIPPPPGHTPPPTLSPHYPTSLPSSCQPRAHSSLPLLACHHLTSSLVTNTQTWSRFSKGHSLTLCNAPGRARA